MAERTITELLKDGWKLSDFIGKNLQYRRPVGAPTHISRVIDMVGKRVQLVSYDGSHKERLECKRDRGGSFFIGGNYNQQWARGTHLLDNENEGDYTYEELL